MSLVVCAQGTSEPGERLEKVIRAFVPQMQVEIYRTHDSLCRRLLQSTYDIHIAVFLATTKEELSEILSVRHLFSDIRIILVLPDREHDTISKAHALRPRFVTYADSDFLDVAAVLSKMLSITYPKQFRSNRSFEAPWELEKYS